MNLVDYGLMEVSAYYAVPPRQYHNLQHALNVHAALTKIYPGPVPGSLQLAALWHDAVYIPKCPGPTNEYMSSCALVHWANTSLTAAHLTNETVEIANALVYHTDITKHLDPTCHFDMEHGALLAYLLDADLHSLALRYEDFVDIQKAIIAENGGDPNDIRDQLGSAKFLSQFLPENRGGRPIYRTDAARALWEDDAQYNIKRWAQGLTQWDAARHED